MVERIRSLTATDHPCQLPLGFDVEAYVQDALVVMRGRQIAVELVFDRPTESVRVLCPAESMTQADLERTTGALQREGWNDPPGTRWVLYHRPGHALIPMSTPLPVTVERPHPVVAELALGGAVLPLFTDSVLVAEQVRAAALSRHETPSEVLSGKLKQLVCRLDAHRDLRFPRRRRRGSIEGTAPP